MKTFQIEVVKIKEFTFEYVCKTVLGQNWPKTDEKELCFKILSDEIKKNRWELFRTFDGYQIINDRYGHFKEIRFLQQLSSDNRPVKAGPLLRCRFVRRSMLCRDSTYIIGTIF